jgi:hypothetical protein
MKWGFLVLFPLCRKVLCGFLSPLKSIASAGFEPANLGSKGKHANQHTTEASSINVTPTSLNSHGCYGGSINGRKLVSKKKKDGEE